METAILLVPKFNTEQYSHFVSLFKTNIVIFLWRLAFRYYENLYSVILSLRIKVKRQPWRYTSLIFRCSILSLSRLFRSDKNLAEISSLYLHFKWSLWITLHVAFLCHSFSFTLSLSLTHTDTPVHARFILAVCQMSHANCIIHEKDYKVSVI